MCLHQVPFVEGARTAAVQGAACRAPAAMGSRAMATTRSTCTPGMVTCVPCSSLSISSKPAFHPICSMNCRSRVPALHTRRQTGTRPHCRLGTTHRLTRGQALFWSDVCALVYVGQVRQDEVADASTRQSYPFLHCRPSAQCVATGSGLQGGSAALSDNRAAGGAGG